MNSVTQMWAMSVKKLGTSKMVKSDYDEYITHCESKGAILREIRYEKDSKGKLHFHCFCELPKSFLRIKLKRTGFHMHLTEVTDAKGWSNYINKDQPKNVVEQKSMFKKTSTVDLTSDSDSDTEKHLTDEDLVDLYRWLSDSHKPLFVRN